MADKNNIEDFLNRSMDNFDGEPSDAVWKGLSARMEAEQPFWKKALFRWLTLGVALWLLSFGLYRQVMMTEMKGLLMDNNRITTENQQLQEALVDCGTLSKVENMDSLSNGSFADAGPLTGLTLNLNQELSLTPFEKTKIFDYSMPKLPAFSGISSGAFSQKMNSFLTTHKAQQDMLFQDEPLQNEVSQAEEEQLAISEKENPITLVENDGEENNSEAKENNKALTNVESAVTSTTMTTAATAATTPTATSTQKLHLAALSIPLAKATKVANPKIDNWHRSLPGTLMLQQQLKLIEVYRFKPSLRFGLSGGSFTTLTDLNSDFGAHFNADLQTNYDAAFALQWQLFRHIALTTELGYNWQAYEKSLSASEQNTVNTFPNTENLNSPVERIRVYSQYIDLPVGLKFNLRGRHTSRSFYLNPGVSWQMWMPQQFFYKTINDGDIRYKEERYFLYFGTAFLNMGMEYRLSKKIHWNIGLTAEKSLADYGLEDRQFLNLGVKAGILFGR